MIDYRFIVKIKGQKTFVTSSRTIETIEDIKLPAVPFEDTREVPYPELKTKIKKVKDEDRDEVREYKHLETVISKKKEKFTNYRLAEKKEVTLMTHNLLSGERKITEGTEITWLG